MENQNLKWIVKENKPKNRHILCSLFENDQFIGDVKFPKNQENKYIEKGSILKTAYVEYDILCPDEKKITDKTITSRREAEKIHEDWIQSFSEQYYYESEYFGRLTYDNLWRFTTINRHVIESK